MKKRRISLVKGRYSTEEIELRYARKQYMKELCELTDFLDEMYKELLPSYHQVDEINDYSYLATSKINIGKLKKNYEHIKDEQKWYIQESIKKDENLLESYSKKIIFLEKTIKLAEKYHLTEEWQLDILFCTLDRWLSNKDSADQRQPVFPSNVIYANDNSTVRLFLSGPGIKGISFKRKLKKLILPIYDPFILNKKDYIKMIEPIINNYIRYQEEAAERFGLERAVPKRSLEHFKWLVYREVKGLTNREIADQYSPEDTILSEDTVSKGIGRAAKLCGLKTKPTSKGGRPRKRKPWKYK